MTPTTKPTDTFARVNRGGSCRRTSATVVRSAFRLVYSPSDRDSVLGFRLTQTGCRQSVDRA